MKNFNVCFIFAQLIVSSFTIYEEAVQHIFTIQNI